MGGQDQDQAQRAVPVPAAADNISDGSLLALKAGKTGVENDGPTVASDAPSVEAHDATRYASIIDLVNATADKPSATERAEALAADLRGEAHKELRKMEVAELARTFSDGWRITGEGCQAALAQRHLPGRLNSGWLTKSSKGWNPFVRTARRFFALVIMDLAELCEKSGRGSGACDGIVLFHADSENTMAATARKPILLDESYGVKRHASLDVPASSYYAFSVQEEGGAGKITLGAQTPRLADAWVWMVQQAMTSKAAHIASPKRPPAPQRPPAPPTTFTRDRFYDSAPHPGRWGESNNLKSAAHDGSLGPSGRRSSLTRAAPQYDLSAILDLHTRPTSGETRPTSGESSGGQVDDARAWGDGSALGFSGGAGRASGSGGRLTTTKTASEDALRSCAATKEGGNSSRCSVVPPFDGGKGRAGDAHASWRHSAPH